MLIDTPRWPAHGRLWAHLVSDRSLAELHAFAAAAGLPRRSFEGDHYDVPDERHGAVVAAGAQLVDGRVLVHALRRSGLRLPKRKGERVLLTMDPGAWSARVDAVASALEPPGEPVGPSLLLAPDDGGRLAVVGAPGAWRLPPAGDQDPRCGYLRLRPAATAATAASWRHLPLRSGRRDELPHVAPGELADDLADDLAAVAPLLAALADHLRGRRPG